MLKLTRMLIGAAVGLSSFAPIAGNAFPGPFPAIIKTYYRQQIAFGEPSLAPMAHTQFCLRYPSECEPRLASAPGGVNLTPERWLELQAVNRKVNAFIAPERNIGGLLTEQWVIAPTAGDCNDYAVTKRHELLERGWPSHALILAEVVTSWGEHHLVLVVRTDQGDLVLDNLRRDIRPIAQARYRWVRAQSPANPKFWSLVRVHTVREPVTLARQEQSAAPAQATTTVDLRSNEPIAAPIKRNYKTGKSAPVASKGWTVAITTALADAAPNPHQN